VNNFKWGIMAAIAAMIISVSLGLLSGVGILHVLLRALIFAVIFFGVGFGLRFLIDSFFTELLSTDEEPSEQESDQPGSRVNIVMDNTGEYAVPELYKTPDPNELGNIEDLISGGFRSRSASDNQSSQSGIDRMKEESYNNRSTFQTFPDQENFSFEDADGFENPQVEKPGVEKRAEKQRADKPAFTPSFGDDVGVGGLPDLEMFALAFSSGGEIRPSQPMAPASVVSVPDQIQEEFVPAQPSRYVAGKPASLKGDFNPKDLAKGISTILSKDK